jgi:hypothetical protein
MVQQFVYVFMCILQSYGTINVETYRYLFVFLSACLSACLYVFVYLSEFNLTLLDIHLYVRVQISPNNDFSQEKRFPKRDMNQVFYIQN